MKFIKIIAFLIIIASLVSCNKNDENINNGLSIDGVSIVTKEIGRASLYLIIEGDVRGDIKRLLYHEKNSSSEYKYIDNGDGLSYHIDGLNEVTTYEILFEVSNTTSKLRTEPVYLSTKFPKLNFYKSCPNKGYYNDKEVFTYEGRQHFLIIDNLEKYDGSHKLFYTNLDHTDSTEISTNTIGDTLFFENPKNMFKNESGKKYKKFNIGFKLNQSYTYLPKLTAIHLDEFSENDILELKVFNSKPSIDSIDVRTTDYCAPGATNLAIYGNYGGMYGFPWMYKSAALQLSDSEGNSIKRLEYTLGEKFSTLKCDGFGFFISNRTERENGLFLYHQLHLAACTTFLTKGDYIIQITFTKSDDEIVKTNTYSFSI